MLSFPKFEYLCKGSRESGRLSKVELKKYLSSMLDEYTIYTRTEYARLEGIKEGREAEKADLAAKMLQEGIPVDSVAKISGLSENEIKRLI